MTRRERIRRRSTLIKNASALAFRPPVRGGKLPKGNALKPPAHSRGDGPRAPRMPRLARVDAPAMDTAKEGAKDAPALLPSPLHKIGFHVLRGALAKLGGSLAPVERAAKQARETQCPSSTRDYWLMSQTMSGTEFGREYSQKHAPSRPTSTTSRPTSTASRPTSTASRPTSTASRPTSTADAANVEQRQQPEALHRHVFGEAQWEVGREVSQKVWLPHSEDVGPDADAAPIIIIPSTFFSGCHARFSLTVMSELPFELEALPPAHTEY
jgi:hypothetical protein